MAANLLKSTGAIAVGALLGGLLVLSGCASQGKRVEASKAKSAAESTAENSDKHKAHAEGHKAEGRKQVAAEDHIVCVAGTDRRIIHVERKQAGGCEVHYTKFDQKEVVATASRDQDHCSRIRDRIRNNLSSAGFTCE